MAVPMLINVGLPRTGTQSFTAAVESLGFSAAHIGYGEHDKEAIAQFKAEGSGEILSFMQRYDVLTDSPYYGLIESLREFHPHISLVATTRTKQDWLASMIAHPAAGDKYLREAFGTADLEDLYDVHAEMLTRHGVRCLALDAADKEKWQVLAKCLKFPTAIELAWPRIDMIGQPGFRNDAKHLNSKNYKHLLLTYAKKALHQSALVIRPLFKKKSRHLPKG